VDATKLEKEPKTTPLRNEAQLNCVSLRSELDCEVTCGSVKGQDERRPSAAPLTAPQVTIGCLWLDVGKEIKEGRHVGLDVYDLLIEVSFVVKAFHALH